MGRLHSWLESNVPLIGDASVWINLVATGQFERIVRTFPGRFVITATAFDELKRGHNKGRVTGMAVSSLISRGLVGLVDLETAHGEVFLELVAGTASETLDDGEAATLAYAAGIGAVALIDERKATSIARKRFPQLRTASTTEMLLSPKLTSFTEEEVREALFLALSLARMRVPDDYLAEVCKLIGSERLQQCPSIPARWRSPPNFVPLGRQPLIAD